jgi:flagellar assembly factor FliW
LGQVDETALLMFVILTIPLDTPEHMTANLRGPVVVNAQTRVAKQLILRDDYPTRAPVFDQQPTQSSGIGQPISLVECHR